MGDAEGEIVQKRGLSAFVKFKKKVRKVKVTSAYPMMIKSTIHFQVLYLMMPWNGLMKVELLLKCCSVQSQIPAQERIVYLGTVLMVLSELPALIEGMSPLFTLCANCLIQSDRLGWNGTNFRLLNTIVKAPLVLLLLPRQLQHAFGKNRNSEMTQMGAWSRNWECYVRHTVPLTGQGIWCDLLYLPCWEFLSFH